MTNLSVLSVSFFYEANIIESN